MATDITTPAPSAPAPSAPSAPAASSAPPPPTSPPRDFESALNAMTDRIEKTPGAPPEPDAEEVIDDEAPPAAPEVVTGDDEPPVDDAAQPESSPPVDAAAPPEDVEYLKEIAPDKIEGGKYWTSKAKWDRLTAADKTVQQLREIDPGITVDSIKEMQGRTLALDTMLADYDSGDPERVNQVAHAFTGTDAEGRPNQNPQAVMAFADQVMANAAQYYPEAFKRVEKKILAGLTQQAYQKYAQTRDEADKHLAWNLDWMLRKDYRRDIDQAPGQQGDALAAERAALEREKQSYQFQKNRDRQAQIAQTVNAAESEAKSAIDQAIEAALSGIPANVREMKAAEYKHAVRDLREGFEEATKANDNYTKPYNVFLSQLRANPTPETRSALVEHVKKWANWTVGRQKPEVVSRFSNGVVQQAAQAHAKQEKLQERREPGGSNGSPVQRATLQQKLRDPKTKYDDAVNMLFNAVAKR